MGFMDKFAAVVDRRLLPIAMALNAQRHICAIRDAFVLAFPITMAGSLILLINFAVLAEDGFIARILFLHQLFPNLSDYQTVLAPVLRGSTDIMSILVVFLVARNVTMALKQDELLGGMTALSAYFVVYPPYANVDGASYMMTQWHGAQGLFVALIIGLLAGEMFSKLAKSDKLTITMPAQVPPAVARSFKVLFPIMIVTISFAVGNHIINLLYPAGIHELIYAVLQTPLRNLGTNIISVIVLAMLSNFLWAFGIHGPNTTAAIREAMFAEATLMNLSHVQETGSAWGAPFPNTWALNDAFSNMGGSGMTLGLLISIFIVSRRKEYRDIAKLSIAPGLFNINEPVIFGLPIVLNPLFIIPFIIIPAINILIGYTAISLGIIPPIAYSVPWTTPGPFIAFLGTGGNIMALLVSAICLVVSVLVYMPFVMAANKAAIQGAEEKE